MTDPIVAFHDFGCTFPGQPAPTLNHLDLEIRPGEFVVIAGSSGAGKTTLALSMNGIVQHVLRATLEGSVQVDGRQVTDCRVSDLASTIGLLFQEPESQFVSLYVRDEIAFGPENLLLPKEEVLRRMRAVMDRIGIADLADKFVYELSGGQKQKVAVAAILAMEPRVLVVDEPSANLDPLSGREIWQLAARLKADGLTVVAIEKNLDNVLPLADRLVVLDQGRVRYDGVPREVISAHGLELLVDLGVWLPQAAELETLVRQATGRSAATVPLTPAEARRAYADRSFVDPGLGPPAELIARPGPSGPPLLEARSLGHAYPDGTEAIRGIDLAIGDGEIVAICGANGSGKTTLVKHFVGLLKPTTGEVSVFGTSTRELSVGEIAGHVGFVFQDPEHQFVKDTVADEIRFSLRVGGIPEADQDAMVGELLGLLHLAGLERRHPFSLSGGEKRRLSVATAVATRPEVLILDEPTYAQDRRTTIEMMRSILALVGGDEASAGTSSEQPRGGRTSAIVLVSHDMRLVSDYATRAVVIDRGQVAFDGTPAALFSQPELVERTRLEVPPIIELARGLREDGRLDFQVRSLAELLTAMR